MVEPAHPSDRATLDANQAPLAKRTITSAIWLLTWRLVTRSLGLLSTLVLARVLIPADFGIIAMATTFAATVDALSQLGLQDALVRRTEDDRRLFDTAFTLQVCRALITSAIVASAAPACVWWFEEPKLLPILLVLAGGAVITGFENVGIAEFRRDMRYDRLFRLMCVPRMIQVAITIPLAFLLRDYWALLAGIVTGQLARVVMGYVLHPYRPKFRIAGWQDLAGFSLWTWASCIVSLAWDRIEPFLLGPAFGPTQLALYLLAAELAMLPLTELVAPVSDALFAAFASAQKRSKAALQHAPLVATMLMMGTMPLAITISFGSDHMVAALLGPKWSGASPLVATLAWLCLFSPVSFVCSVALIANGHVRRNFYGKLAAAAVKLVVLSVAVASTDRLEVVASAVTLCVAIESCCFGLLLKGLLQERLGPLLISVLRVGLAGCVAMLALHVAGIDATPALPESALQAAFAGFSVAAMVALTYLPSLAAIWYLAGSPDGPETRVAEILVGYLRPLALRLSTR